MERYSALPQITQTHREHFITRRIPKESNVKMEECSVYLRVKRNKNGFLEKSSKERFTKEFLVKMERYSALPQIT